MNQTFIEQLQRDHLSGKAAKQSILSGDTSNFLSVFTNQIGVTDGFLRNYGDPLAPFYKAISGKPIDVQRINQFHTLLREDLLVGRTALELMKSRLEFVTKQHYLRLESLKSVLDQLRVLFNVESIRRTTGGQWVFSEDFKNISRINATSSTVWIDSKTGSVSLPTADVANAIRSTQITLEQEFSFTTTGSFVGTTSLNCLDGQDGTVWLVKGGAGQAIWKLKTPWELNQLTLEPVGQGVAVQVDLYHNGVWERFCSEVLYAPKTVSRPAMKAEKIRITVDPLKETGGLKRLILWSASYAREGVLLSKSYSAPVSISRARLSWLSDTPSNSKIRAFISAGASGPWISVSNGNDKRLTEITYEEKELGIGEPLGRTWVYKLDDAVSTLDSKVEIGKDQIEISCFPFDWRAIADPSHIPTQQDWINAPVNARKTWARIEYEKSLTEDDPLVVPNNADSFESLSGNAFLHTNTLELNKSSLGIVLLTGNASNLVFMPGNNYRFRFFVECSEPCKVEEGELLFFAGVRADNARSYEEARRPIASCSLAINDEVVLSKAYPRTIFSSMLSAPTADLNFSPKTSDQVVFDLKAGWNKIEIFAVLADQTGADRDVDDITDPYVEIRFAPDFFNIDIKAKYGIKRIIGTGNFSPLSEFDLEWNLLPDPTAWAWSTGQFKAIKVNCSNSAIPLPIDGNYKGTAPNRSLYYQKGGSVSQNLYVKFELERDPLTYVGPILRGYQLYII